MKKLRLLQSFRAIAPILILLLHATQIFEVNLLNMHHIEKTGGVDLFFVMSGFLLYYIYSHKFGQSGEASRFLVRRISRIFPLVWILSIFYFCLSQFAMWEPYDMERLLPSLFVLPTDNHILDTTWSLSHIVFFYFAIALLLWKPEFKLPFLTTVINIMILLLFFDFWPEENMVFKLIFNLYNFEFLLGCFAAVLVRKYRIKWGFGFLTLGIGGYGYTWYVMMSGNESIALEVLFGFSAFFLIIGGAGLDQAREIRIPRVIKVLEQSSYALYLAHLPLLILSMQLYEELELYDVFSNSVACTISVSVITLLSIGIHYWIEKPVDRIIQGKLTRFYGKKKTPKHDTVPSTTL
ncbi:acyltransferase [Rossellomorea sp. AcN35-11]|nr:acyltransferase [Rossellomorea aquimaris]WJV31393.1 acyltransferase [Rossellomorea sp. AcN35-11]